MSQNENPEGHRTRTPSYLARRPESRVTPDARLYRLPRTHWRAPVHIFAAHGHHSLVADQKPNVSIIAILDLLGCAVNFVAGLAMLNGADSQQILGVVFIAWGFFAFAAAIPLLNYQRSGLEWGLIVWGGEIVVGVVALFLSMLLAATGNVPARVLLLGSLGGLIIAVVVERTLYRYLNEEALKQYFV